MSYISDLKHIVVELPILQTCHNTRNREWSRVWQVVGRQVVGRQVVGNGNYPIIRLNRNPKRGCS